MNKSFIALILLLPSSALAADYWARCAAEGQTCTLGTGTFTVRYGAAGKFVTKSADNAIACNNDVFGDPIVGTRKSCDFLIPETWTKCADEGKTCTFEGTRTVRYGAAGKTVTKTFTGSTPCTNDVFGDPILGTVKVCEVQTSEHWAQCGTEGQTCTFPGAHDVRYGAKDRFDTKRFTDKVACDNKTFKDPIVGTVKACQVRYVGVEDPAK